MKSNAERLREKHIRAEVRKLMAKSDGSIADILPGVRYVRDPKQKLAVRLVWGTLIFTCLILSLYQICDRIGYFFEYPVSIDTKFNVITEEDVRLTSTMCCADTKMMGELRLKFGFDTYNKDQLDRYCMNDIIKISRNLNMSVEEWYRYIDTKDTIERKEVELVNGTIVDDVLEETGTPLIFGLCSTFQLVENTDMLSSTVTMKKAPNTCDRSRVLITVQQKGDPVYLSKILSFGTKQFTDCVMTQKLYFFVNTRRNPCSTIAEFSKCYRNCIVKKIKANENIVCKFPFVPEEVDLPICYLGTEATERTLKELNLVYMKSNPVGDCGCPRLCTQLANKFYGDTFLMSGTVYKVTIMREGSKFVERRAYEAIALFCDIGGNLGLFLGFSVLSIVQIVLSSARYAKFRYDNFKKANGVSLSRSKEQYHSAIREQLAVGFASNNASPFWDQYFSLRASVWIRLLVQIICLFSCVYFIYNRTVYYLQYPKRTVVELVYAEKVLFPDIVMCGISNYYLDTMTELSRANPNFKDKKCEITLLDFMDYFDAEFLWKNSSISHQFISLIASGNAESFFGLPLVNARVDDIPLPEGSCARFSAGEQNFIGTLTMLNIVGIFSSECSDYQTMYVYYPAQDDFDIRLGYTLRMMVQSATILELQQIERLNLPHEPCVNSAETAKCKRDCVKRKLKRRLSCRLPYMPSVDLPTCVKTVNGTLADALYRNIHATIDHFKDIECNCKLPCTQNILNVVMTNEPFRGPDINVNSVFFLTNFYEKFVEVNDYSFIKLICDIGGMMGITLGLSIVSLMDVIHSAALSLITMRKNLFVKY